MMVDLLYEEESEGKRLLNQYAIELTAGQSFKIEIGNDDLVLTCPAGKQWSGGVSFSFIETDA